MTNVFFQKKIEHKQSPKIMKKMTHKKINRRVSFIRYWTTSLVAQNRDTGGFSVSTLPLPTQACQAPFPGLHFMAALNCNHFSYSRFPIWVSLYSCFYCMLSNKGLSFLKEVCYVPFNSCMCVYCICWVAWECVNWKWSKLSVGLFWPPSHCFSNIDILLPP